MLLDRFSSQERFLMAKQANGRKSAEQMMAEQKAAQFRKKRGGKKGYGVVNDGPTTLEAARQDRFRRNAQLKRQEGEVFSCLETLDKQGVLVLACSVTRVGRDGEPYAWNQKPLINAVKEAVRGSAEFRWESEFGPDGRAVSVRFAKVRQAS